MKINIDTQKCMGCGVCTDLADNIFELKNGVSCLKDNAELESPESKEIVDMVVNCCSSQAITVDE